MPNGAFNRAFEKVTMHDYSVEPGRWVPPIDSNTRIHICKQFKGDFSTGIWNSTALFGRDPVKAVQRLQYACKLANQVDILFLVEAHGQDGCQIVLSEQLRCTHKVMYFPGISNAVGGIVVCVRLRIISICGEPTSVVVDEGRVVCLTFTSRNESLGAIGVHIDPHYTFLQKKYLLQKIARQIKLHQDMTWVVCGDFNFEAFGERAFNTHFGAFMESASSENLAVAWNEVLGHLVEHHQADFTRAQNGPFGVTLSRLDRIYSNLPSWRLLTTEVRTMTVGRVTDDGRLSDHIPVLSFVCGRIDRIMGALPLWTTKDPFYKFALNKEIEHYNFETTSAADGVQEIKKCMRKACRRVAEKSSRRGAKTIEEQIYWSLLCVRALFHGHGRTAIRALIAYPALEDFILIDSSIDTKFACNMAGLNEHIALLMRESLGRLLSDIDETAGMPEYEKDQRKTSVKRLMDRWATRNRKASLQACRDSAGNVISEPDKAAEVFVTHWKKVAEEKYIDKYKARAFLRQYMRKIPHFRTVLSFEEFLQIVRELPDSACGPDGVPYSAWRNASDEVVRVLYRLYCSLFTDGIVADDFNHAWLALLAKGDHDDDDHSVARTAEDTRPVSLANSDSKICETALNQPLAKAMDGWASWDQRGFIKGRMMVDNIIEIDTHSRIAALSFSKGSGTERLLPGLPIMAFFDFAQAFPSVAWAYLWMCMKYCGLPRPYVRAFKKMYANNVHFLRFMGRVYRAYVNASGVKTGGTASGTIFVLCIDPFLQMLRSRCGPRDFGRGFADDIGYVIFDLRVTLPAFAECFLLFGIVSSVKLKIKKTIIIPLWSCTVEEATQIIWNVVPAWQGVKVDFHAKYLGIQLGPRSASVSWDGALDKYIAKVQFARSTGAGLLSSVLEYNIVCVSSLAYVGQFYATSRQVLATEAKMLQRMTGSPRYTFSKESLWNLSSFGMAHSFHPVQVANTAAMVRMALQTTTVLPIMKTMFDGAVTSDEAMMQSLVSGEVDSFDTPAMVNTLQKAIDSAFLPDIQRSSWKLYLQSVRGNMLGVSLQAVVFKYLKGVSCDFNANEFLSKRMQRWQHAVSDDAKQWWSFIGPFVVQLCCYEMCGAPQCVIAAYLKTVLNGWAFARRLRLDSRQCIFACGSKLDSIEHYMECHKVERIWQQISSSDWGTLECRLAVGCATVGERISRVFFLYGLYSAYNAMRHGRVTSDVIDNSTEIVKCKIRYALGKSSPGMRQIYGDMLATRSPSIRRDYTGQCVGDCLFSFRKRARTMQTLAAARDNSGPKRVKLYRF